MPESTAYIGFLKGSACKYQQVLIGDPSETDIHYQRPTFTIEDRHGCKDPWETNMPAESKRNLNTYIFKFTYFYLLLLIYIYWNNVMTLIRHVGLQWARKSPMKHVVVSDQVCQSLWSGMSVSDGSPMKHVDISDGSLIRHVGLRSGMSVSDGSPIVLRWVSYNNNIFVNSSCTTKNSILMYEHFYCKQCSSLLVQL